MVLALSLHLDPVFVGALNCRVSCWCRSRCRFRRATAGRAPADRRRTQAPPRKTRSGSKTIDAEDYSAASGRALSGSLSRSQTSTSASASVSISASS